MNVRRLIAAALVAGGLLLSAGSAATAAPGDDGYRAPSVVATVSDPTPAPGQSFSFTIQHTPNTPVTLTITAPASIPDSAITIAGTKSLTKTTDAAGSVTFTVTLAQAGTYTLTAVDAATGAVIATEVLAVTSSGTGAVEAAVASAVPPDGVVLTLENGHYGERMRQIAQSHGIPVRRFEVPWGRPLDARDVAARLATEPQVTHVTLVHHETSTAMLNDLAGIARVVADAGRSLVVDAVSSVGCEDVDVAAQGVDWLAGTSNKCLEGMPGLSFVTARADLLDALDGRPGRGYTVDLGRHHRAQARAGVPARSASAQCASRTPIRRGGAGWTSAHPEPLRERG
ncbi:aminotransferase class V-fold PLP-dependent enzyme, partial [Cellulomonas septica]